MLLDLGVLNKKSHAISNREAAIWSVTWISLAMGFSGIIYYYLGAEQFMQFQGAYWIEKALSVDNLFVFILVFGYFNVAKEAQHKVLFWGVLGALFFRAIFIFTGVWILNYTYLPEMELFGHLVKINYLLTIFGIILIVAGFKSWFSSSEDDGDKDFSNSRGIDDWMIKKAYNKDLPIKDYYDTFYSIMPFVYDNKIPATKVGNFNFTKDAAYHMDAAAFGEFLKEKVCIPKGVNYIQKKIEQIFREK